MDPLSPEIAEPVGLVESVAPIVFDEHAWYVAIAGKIRIWVW
jgi:hypothetical protein